MANPGFQVDLQQLGFKLSENVLRNIFAESVTAYGVVNTDYQGNVEGNASVYVLKQKRYDGEIRELNSGANDDWSDNTGAFTPASDMYQLDIKYVYTKRVEIKALLLASLPYDLDTIYTDMIVKQFAESVDKLTIGVMTSATLAFAVANADSHFLVVDPAAATFGEDLYDKIQDAQDLITGGNPTTGDTTAPFDGRSVLLRPEARSAMMKTKGIITESNLGQEMIATNKFHQGTVADAAVVVVPQQLFKTAKVKKVVGQTTHTLTIADGIYGIVTHPIATTRATDFSLGVKAQPNPNDQGINLLPAYRLGVESFRPWATVVIGKAAFLAAYKALGA
jgi:hypothetical protein